jgi:myo-inositol 2-dehydrogenase / D-chiro-inositol 1-dehydrogenase
MQDIGIGIVGSGFVAEFHALAFARLRNTSLRAVASPSPGHAERFAARHAIPFADTDFRRLLERTDVDIVSIAAPNDLHRDVAVSAAAAGKHVICEKPLAHSLAAADEMISACDRAGVLLMYAEELCFVPKYARAKQLVDEGALGTVHFVRHGEQHSGPHSDWFWDPERAGGGVLVDMGCHGVELIRWMLDKPAVESVSAELSTFVHGDRTVAEDHAVATIRFEDGRLGLVESSWAKPGGIDDRAELFGSTGVSYVDTARGSALLTYSESGYAYAAEKAETTRGWTFTSADELWESGIPQEMEHFVDCAASGAAPRETGRDGRAVLEIIYGLYLSGRTGRVTFPLELDPADAALPPYRLWRPLTSESA